MSFATEILKERTCLRSKLALDTCLCLLFQHAPSPFSLIVSSSLSNICIFMCLALCTGIEVSYETLQMVQSRMIGLVFVSRKLIEIDADRWLLIFVFILFLTALLFVFLVFLALLVLTSYAAIFYFSLHLTYVVRSIRFSSAIQDVEDINKLIGVAFLFFLFPIFLGLLGVLSRDILSKIGPWFLHFGVLVEVNLYETDPLRFRGLACF